MRMYVFVKRSVLCSVVLLLGSSLSPSFIHAEDGRVKGAMILAPAEKLSDVAAGAVEDTLKACLARIPEKASMGQRMLAERTCQGEEGVRKTNQGPPQF
ncbi:MAG: exported protein of unknown function [Nitrospira sp.]|nr:exported protein of unknown function [Nitrospira sp.]